MVGCGIRLKKKEAGWLSNLLRCKFFDTCTDHPDHRKNEKNMFCIDCIVGFCKHCMDSPPSPHGLHQWFQVCKYVYHDVVRLQDIQKHLDCSKIQTYKINGEKAVHLNPRPQLKDAKGANSKGGASCEACGRHIQDWPNAYCSISCKLSSGEPMAIPNAELNNSNAGGKCDIQSDAKENDCCSSISESSGPEVIEEVTEILKSKKQLRKRKGVPRRAPLF